MEIKPNKKLFTKQLYVLLTISFLVLLVAVILQITISFNPKVSASRVAAILWPIAFGIIILFLAHRCSNNKTMDKKSILLY